MGSWKWGERIIAEWPKEDGFRPNSTVVEEMESAWKERKGKTKRNEIEVQNERVQCLVLSMKINTREWKKQKIICDENERHYNWRF